MRFRSRKGLIERAGRVRRQVVLHDPDPLGLRKVDIHELAHAQRELCAVRRSVTLDPAPGPVRVHDHEQVHRAVRRDPNRPARPARARPGWAGAPGRSADWAFIKAHHRALRIGRLGVKIKHVLHTGDVVAIDLRNAPHLFAPGFELPPRTRWRASIDIATGWRSWSPYGTGFSCSTAFSSGRARMGLRPSASTRTRVLLLRERRSRTPWLISPGQTSSPTCAQWPPTRQTRHRLGALRTLRGLHLRRPTSGHHLLCLERQQRRHTNRVVLALRSQRLTTQPRTGWPRHLICPAIPVSASALPPQFEPPTLLRDRGLDLRDEQWS